MQPSLFEAGSAALRPVKAERGNAPGSHKQARPGGESRYLDMYGVRAAGVTQAVALLVVRRVRFTQGDAMKSTSHKAAVNLSDEEG